MKQFIKMTWMFFWRLFILSVLSGEVHLFAVLSISMIAAGVLRFGLKKTIHVFPIITLFMRKKVILNIVNPYAPSTPVQQNNSLPYENKNIITQASRGGIITGYETHILKDVPVPDTNYVSRMRGIPGSGLDSATHMEGENITSGQIGESNFSKALSITTIYGNNQGFTDERSIINNVNTFWSVAMPTAYDIAKRDKYDTDIDCIVVSDNEILLVDTKYYSSGDVTYKMHDNMIYCEDNNMNNTLVGKPHEMTKNMAMAQERIQKHFPNMRVSSIVVLMPTYSGSPKIDNVYWPGNIKAVNINEALERVSRMSQNSRNANPDVLRKISTLVKH